MRVRYASLMLPAACRFLANPWLSRAGNASFLGGILWTAGRLLFGLPPLTAGAVIVATSGVLLMATPHIARLGRRTRGSTSPPVPADAPPASPRDLLSAAYRDGVRLRTHLVWADGAPHSPEESAATERRAQTKAREWAEQTWLMLLEHFPAHEQEFYGPGNPALGHTGFWLSAIEEMQARRADSYIESKLALLRRLLPREDDNRSAIDEPTRGRTLPLQALLMDPSSAGSVPPTRAQSHSRDH